MREDSFQAKLSQEIFHEYSRLIEVVTPLSKAFRTLKRMEGTGGDVSVGDLIAYQIGWGKCLISWYEDGVRNRPPQIPGEGFSSWDYNSIAQHFYKKYQYDFFQKQEKVFDDLVSEILRIVEKEHKTGNLYKLGAWPWCTLGSGKEWPFSKWIKVNTASPYKRAALMIKKMLKKSSLLLVDSKYNDPRAV